MDKILGNLSIMPLSDLIQWADSRCKTGSLHFSLEKKKRILFFEDGNIIFASSSTSGERLGEYLLRSSSLNKKQLNDALGKSKKLKIPFTRYLVSEKMIQKDELCRIISNYAEFMVTDALTWDKGVFAFLETIPPEIINGPIHLQTLPLVFESFRTIDESQQNEKININKILENIADKINNDDIEIPPIPDILNKLNLKIEQDAPTKDIAAIIVTDQILTTNILKIANSPFFRQVNKTISLNQATMQLGIKAIKNMVTAHTLSGLRSKNPDKVREVMKHSLVCAFAARTLAEMFGENPEEVFVCGLLHDIGKTVLINILSEYDLSEANSKWFLDKYHGAVGDAIAKKWNLSDIIRNVARYHHTPEGTKHYQKTVEIVYIADMIANDLIEDYSKINTLTCIDLNKIDLPSVIDKISNNKDKIMAMI